MFQNVDYELAPSSSDAVEASGEYVRREDEDEELRYGEFDMDSSSPSSRRASLCWPRWRGRWTERRAGCLRGRGKRTVRSPCWLPRSGRGRGARTGVRARAARHRRAGADLSREEAASEAARDDADESGRAAERENAMPSFDSRSASFARGDMYDADALTDATRGASMVFMFSTKFAVDGDGRLAVSPMLRPALATGAVVVTVNNELATADGFELVARADGPDGERSGGSTAYVWRAV